MTNANVVAKEILPQAGANNSGWKFGFVASGAKVAQSDTWTVTNASVVLLAHVYSDSGGTGDVATIGTGASSNVLTLNSATTGASSGLILFRK